MKELTLAEKKQFFSSIDTLYKSGISYTELFATIEYSSTNINVKQLAAIFRSGIECGVPITELMMKYKDVVSPQYAMLFCAGDKSGKLEDTIIKITDDIKRNENLKTALIGALTYPALLLLGCIGVMIFCHSFFFKVFDSMYSFGGCQLSISALLINTLFQIAVVYAAIFFLVYFMATNKRLLQKMLDFIVERTFLAPLVNNVYFINFFYVLSASYDAGIPIKESMEMASTLFETKQSVVGIIKANSVLKKGGDIKSAFISAQIFSPFALSQIATGEKTGRLGQAFKDIAKDYENQLQAFLAAFVALLQPATIVIIGIIVAHIALTFYKKLYGGIFSIF